jgi:tetratricopeptide (TPR) repeat protein
MWSDAFAEASPDAPPLTQEWLQKLGVRLDPPPQIAPRRFKETEQQRTVARPGAASTIAAALRRRETNAVAQAETLLAYQRRAVELHGDAHPFVQSLCWFAHEVDRQDPDRAVRWASEARLWEPWNHYTWITLLTAQRRAEGDDLAVATALEASERFPNVSAAWLELGISLRGVGATLEAEEALLEARHRFPDDPKTWSALGELFLAVDEPDRAIETLREAYLAFPSNPYLGPGLARALSQTGDDEEARRLLEQAAADFPNNELVRRRLTELRAGKRLPVERAERLDPGGRTQNPRALLARSKLLRRRARRLGNEASGRQAFELAEAAARLAPLSARASAEQALLLLEQERSHDAWNILQEAHQKHGDHLGLLYVEARVRRVEAENQRLPFSEETLDSIVGPLRSAARGNPFLRPFTDFQVGRACFSLHDGQPLEARRTAEVARLRAWLERLPKSVDSVGSAANIHEADNAFLGWWMWRAVEKNDDVLRGSKDADRGVRQNATFPVGKGGEIDSIEEDFPNRIITSAEFMLA